MTPDMPQNKGQQTKGHPYGLQLICHIFFPAWSQMKYKLVPALEEKH